MKDELKLNDMERSALEELSAQGEINMFGANVTFAKVMTALVEKGFVEVTGMAWIPCKK